MQNSIASTILGVASAHYGLPLQLSADGRRLTIDLTVGEWADLLAAAQANELEVLEPDQGEQIEVDEQEPEPTNPEPPAPTRRKTRSSLPVPERDQLRQQVLELAARPEGVGAGELDDVLPDITGDKRTTFLKAMRDDGLLRTENAGRKTRYFAIDKDGAVLPEDATTIADTEDSAVDTEDNAVDNAPTVEPEPVKVTSKPVKKPPPRPEEMVEHPAPNPKELTETERLAEIRAIIETGDGDFSLKRFEHLFASFKEAQREWPKYAAKLFKMKR